MTNPGTPDRTAVFTAAGPQLWQPSVQARGPWDARAQHGGAPCALLTHIVEQAAGEPGWQTARLMVDLLRPVPLSLLRHECTVQRGRSTLRATAELWAGEQLVARAQALLLRAQPVALPPGLPGWTPAALTPPPEACSVPVRFPGMPEGDSFYRTAMEHRVAEGNPSEPGPSSAWFRFARPFVAGAEVSPAMLAAAACDFGNGLSWVLPLDRYVFSNADVTLHLLRPPVGEWVGVQSQTQIAGDGVGLTATRLYDAHGAIGTAAQTLVVRPREA